MPRGKNCKSCSALNSSASKKCTTCGIMFDKCGRPADTKASNGYLVCTSGDRPTNIKASDGYAVSKITLEHLMGTLLAVMEVGR